MNATRTSYFDRIAVPTCEPLEGRRLLSSAVEAVPGGEFTLSPLLHSATRFRIVEAAAAGTS